MRRGDVARGRRQGTGSIPRGAGRGLVLFPEEKRHAGGYAQGTTSKTLAALRNAFRSMEKGAQACVRVEVGGGLRRKQDGGWT